MKAFVTPTTGADGQTFAYEVGENKRVSFVCTRKSEQHIPDCRAQILNRFESYNDWNAGYPDAIKKLSTGRVLLGAITLGSPRTSIAQIFQALLPLLPPIQGDTPGRLVHELLLDGDENGSEIWCNQYSTRPPRYAIRSCIANIDKPKKAIDASSIPLDITVEMDERESNILSEQLKGKTVQGFMTEVDSTEELSVFIGPIRPWMSLKCNTRADCQIHLTHRQRRTR